jgi:hypothetical protein
MSATGSSLPYTNNGSRSIALQEPILIFHVYMQLVTPSAVAIADSTLIAVCTTNFQNVLFFITAD